MPLVKNKCGNLADKNNYRPIALSSISSKIFEHVILFRVEDVYFLNLLLTENVILTTCF